MIKAFVVDDQDVIIDGLIRILSASPEIEIIGEALDGDLLLEALKTKQPDIILLDISMPTMNGIATAKIVKELYPDIKILIFTTFINRSKVKQIIKIGVEGCMLKDSKKTQIIDVVKAIMDGSTHYDERVTKLMNKKYKKKSSRALEVPLSEREIEVCKLILEGKTNNEISEELVLSVNTVNSHRKHIFSKLGINKSIELAQYAYEKGWFDS